MSDLAKPLSDWIQPGGMSIHSFIQAALALTESVWREHQKGHFLLWLEPGKIHVQESMDGFDCVALGAGIPAGPARYLAPEQTGRTGLPVDERADLYVLGLIFHELLTGISPFPTDDYRQLIHSHLAVPAPLPSQFRADVPPALDKMCIRLLQKNPAARFSSARDLLAFLGLCQQKLDFSEGIWSIPNFDLAYPAESPLAIKPERPIGQEQEQAQLAALLEKVQDRGQAIVVLVSGPAGIGKSTLVQSTSQSLDGQTSGCYLGKFDQYRDNTPFSALIEVIHTFLRQFLNQDPIFIERFRQGLVQQAADSLPVLLELAPQLVTLTGPVQNHVTYSPSERQYHLQAALKALLRQAAPDKPALVVLEDIQWADSGSLRLVEQILDTPQDLPMLLILTCRSENLLAGHPAARWLEQGQVVHLNLKSFGIRDVRQWLASILADPGPASDALAELCFEKSQGNPLYIQQYMQYLLDHEVFIPSKTGQAWVIQMDHLLKTGAPDDVLILIQNRLADLSRSTLEVLEWASCMNHTFSVALLSGCTGHSRANIQLELLTAEQNHLIQKDLLEAYRFAHDRIQQVLAQNIEPIRLERIHQTIGLYLARQLGWPSGSRIGDDAYLLEAADHLRAARIRPDQIPGWGALELVLLFQAAGSKSQDLLAYDRALTYDRLALEYLDLSGQDEQHSAIRLDLLVAATASAYRSGQFAAMDDFASQGLSQSRKPLDQARIIEIQIERLTTGNHYREAFKLAKALLSKLDIHFPEKPSYWDIFWFNNQVRLKLGQNPEKMLANLKPMTDPHVLMAVRILVAAGIAAYSDSGPTFMLVLLYVVRLSLQHGIAPETPVSLVAYGQFLCVYQNKRRQGYAFGKMAVDMQRQLSTRAHASKAYMVFEIIIRYHREPLAATLNQFPHIHEIGLATGDLSSAGHAMMQHFVYLFHAGRPLQEIADLFDQYRLTLLQTQDYKSISVCLSMRQAVRNILEKRSQPWLLDGPDFCDTGADFLALSGEEGFPILFNVYLAKMILAVHCGQMAVALDYLAETVRTESGAIGTYIVPVSWFYGALVHLAVARTGLDSRTRRRHLRKARAFFRRLARLERDCPANFSNKLALIEAEYQRSTGHLVASLAWYEQAIELSGKQGFTAELVLCHACAADMLVEQGRKETALPYLAQASRLARSWGDLAWADRLWQACQGCSNLPDVKGTRPGNPPESPVPQPSEAPAASGDQDNSESRIDLETLLLASQAISEELIFDDLLKKVIDHVLVHAGANLALFIVESESGLRVEASGTAQGRNLVIQNGCLVREIPGILEKLVNYVFNTGEAQIAQHPADLARFLPDHASEAANRSVICLPVESRQTVTGLLYIENDLMEQAFTGRQIEILRVIAAQLAVSIDNARLYQRLEQMVEQRTAQLNQKNLELAQANQVREQFMATMSHEIRTPLQGIIGMASTLQRSLADTMEASAAEALQQSAQSLLLMLNDVLDLSKLSAGKMAFEARDFSLRQLVHELVPVFAGSARRKRLDFSVEIAPDAVDGLHGDALRLKQVLANLLSNAIKFTREGSVRLSVQNWQENQRIRLTFQVEDTGIGIASDLHTKIFEDFVQGDTSTARQYGGTGLGLAITRKIVEQMGGEIWVESEPGRGSRFVCRMDLDPAQSPDLLFFEPLPQDALDEQQTHPVPSPRRRSFKQARLSELARQLSGLSVLIGEDDAVSRTYFSALLRHLNCNVQVAPDGAAVLRALENQTFDCLLLDKNMPGLDGLAVTRQIRHKEQQSGSRLPIIALTASALTGEREKLLAAGMDDYLSKPVDEILLAERLLAIKGRSSDQETVVLDWEHLREDMEMVGAEVFVSVLSDFAKTLPVRMEEIGLMIELIKSGNPDPSLWPQLSREFHRLAGSLAAFHATSLTSQLKDLEQSARSLDVAAMELRWQSTRLQLASFQAHLPELIAAADDHEGL
ncbi:MAG: ATP-binding protein [Eubacteriales bacterium]|nr:ATP-binding protein [Eubacteriales bacterium]